MVVLYARDCSCHPRGPGDFILDLALLLTIWDQILFRFSLAYRRTGFKCEHVIIANCNFSPSVQLLECNVYITYGVINT